MTPDELRRERDVRAQDGETAAVVVGADATLAVDPPRDRWPGLTVGHYRLHGLIGQGGMGSVYKAVRGDDQDQDEMLEAPEGMLHARRLRETRPVRGHHIACILAER